MTSCGIWLDTRRLVAALHDHHGAERFLSVSPTDEAQDAFLAYLAALAPVTLVLADCAGMRSNPLVAGAAPIADIYLAPELLLEGILTAAFRNASARRRAQVLSRLPSSPLRAYLHRLPAPPPPASRQISLL